MRIRVFFCMCIFLNCSQTRPTFWLPLIYRCYSCNVVNEIFELQKLIGFLKTLILIDLSNYLKIQNYLSKFGWIPKQSEFCNFEAASGRLCNFVSRTNWHVKLAKLRPIWKRLGLSIVNLKAPRTFQLPYNNLNWLKLFFLAISQCFYWLIASS